MKDNFHFAADLFVLFLVRLFKHFMAALIVVILAICNMYVLLT